MDMTWQMFGLAEVGNPVMISICLWFVTYFLVALNLVLNFKEFKVWKCTLGMLMLLHVYLVLKALYEAYMATGGAVV